MKNGGITALTPRKRSVEIIWEYDADPEDTMFCFIFESEERKYEEEIDLNLATREYVHNGLGNHYQE